MPADGSLPRPTVEEPDAHGWLLSPEGRERVTLEEPGTEFFCISLDPDEPEVVWLHEWFIGEDGITAHRSAPG